MSLLTLIGLAARNLLRNKRRTALLGMALAAVTALMVILQGISGGVRQTIVLSATTLFSGEVNVGGFFKVTAGQSTPLVTHFDKVEAVVKRSVPDLDFVVQRGRGWAKVVSDTGSLRASLNGLEVQNEPGFNKVVSLVAGNLADLSKPNTILVFEGQLKKLGVKVGDAVTISVQTARGANNTVDCRVAAIARDVGLLSAWSVFIPMETMRALGQLREDATGVLQIHTRDREPTNLGVLAARLRTELERAGYRVMREDPRPFFLKFQTINREEWTGQKLDVSTWEDEVAYVTWVLSLLDGLSMVLMIIIIAVVVTGILNIMWVAIRERTREIGALRAMGMRRGNVLRMFMFEALVLSLVAACVGALAASVLVALINARHFELPPAAQNFLMSDHLRLVLELPAVLRAIFILTSVSGLAAIYPSMRAARLRPIVAMSHIQ